MEYSRILKLVVGNCEENVKTKCLESRSTSILNFIN